MLKDLKLEGKELVYYKALHMGTTSYVIYINAPALRACGQESQESSSRGENAPVLKSW